MWFSTSSLALSPFDLQLVLTSSSLSSVINPLLLALKAFILDSFILSMHCCLNLSLHSSFVAFFILVRRRLVPVLEGVSAWVTCRKGDGRKGAYVLLRYNNIVVICVRVLCVNYDGKIRTRIY